MVRKRAVLTSDPLSPPTSTEAAAAERHFVTALARGLEVLACFRKSDVLLDNQEIASRCNLPKSTVSRLTFTLTRLGYLHYVEPLAKYRLGTAVLTLGTSMLARLDVRNIARPLMGELAAFSNAHIGLAARDRLSMVYVECCRGEAAVSLTLDVGSRVSISTSAMGRGFLAACTEEERAPILDEIRAIDPAGWPRTRDGILQAIEDVGTIGCACSFGDWQPNVNAIAVGFRPGGGLPPMAINCGAPGMIVTTAFLLGEVRPKLVAIGRRLAGTMGS